MKTFKLIFLILMMNSYLAFGESFSMRKCMLLPITDEIGSVLGYKVYEEVEAYLKELDWCEYKSNAEMLGVFTKYRDKLALHLNDPQVIQTVANNLKVGSIFRIKLKNEVSKLKVELDVIGENGQDIYLSEKSILDKPDLLLAFNTIKNWLEIYEAAIPYDGKLNGILGDQVTFSISNKENFVVGQTFVVKRLIKKKEHPLLQKIVAWESKKLAEGKIFNISSGQALGVIKRYYGRTKLMKGDWIKLEQTNIISKRDQDNSFEPVKSYEFGKLGEVDLSLDFSSSSVGTSVPAGSLKMSGYLFGLSASTETWITRNYFVLGEFSRKVGTLNKNSGSPSINSVSISSGHLKIAGGYKYLPMGFFYGPQVNLYAGYVSYSYNVEKSQADGFGQTGLSGFLFGVGGSLPLDKGVRLFVSGELIPFAEFSDESNIFGSSKSNSSINLKFGGLYQYNPKIKLVGSVELLNNSTSFNSNSISELNHRDTILKVGTRFTF